MGAEDEAVSEALAQTNIPGGDEEDRLFVYLANLAHVRFLAVARRDWTDDVALLEAMVAADPAAKSVVEQHIDDKGMWDYTVGAVIGMFSAQREQTLYERLAENQDLIQTALAEKDWSQTPDQARQLLRMSVPEARARESPPKSTRQPCRLRTCCGTVTTRSTRCGSRLRGVGVIATIAIGIFGQMAKRWKDMNA